MPSSKVPVVPPKAAQRYAELGLAARDQALRSKRCCTRAGLARARSILAGDDQDAVEIRAWFRRHRGNYEKARARAVAEGLTVRQAAPDEPAIQAWWIWGGDPMRDAVEAAVARKGNPEDHVRTANPVPLIAAAGAVVASALVGSALTATTLGGNPPEVSDLEELPRYKGAILVFPKHGWVGEVIDLATGKNGYDHVGLDLGWIVEGKPVHVESMMRQGVRLVDPETYNREPLRVPLTVSDTTYARGVAESLLRSRTRYRGRPGGIHCAEFVIRCLPRKWRKGLPQNPTPNQLAQAWIKPRRTKTQVVAPPQAE